MVRTTRPQAEPLEAWVPPRNSSSTTATAPVRLPRMETAQCLSITAVEMRLDSQGTEVIVVPVNRSEPLMTTSPRPDRKSTRLNSSHVSISYAVFCLKKKKHRKSTTNENIA